MLWTIFGLEREKVGTYSKKSHGAKAQLHDLHYLPIIIIIIMVINSRRMGWEEWVHETYEEEEKCIESSGGET